MQRINLHKNPTIHATVILSLKKHSQIIKSNSSIFPLSWWILNHLFARPFFRLRQNRSFFNIAKGAYIKMHYTDDLFGNKEYTFDVLSYGPLTYLKEEKKDNQKNNTSTKIYDGGRGENCNLCEEWFWITHWHVSWPFLNVFLKDWICLSETLFLVYCKLCCPSL